MGAFKAYFILLCVLLLCTACAEVNEVQVKKTEPVIKPLEKNIVQEKEVIIDNVSKPEHNPYLDHNYSDVLNHSQLPTSARNENKRYRKYGTLIDLDTLNVSNCQDYLDDFEDQIIDAADELKDQKKDIIDARDFLESQYNQLEIAEESGDFYDIKDANGDINDADDLLKKEKQDVTDIERHLNELQETLDAVEAECSRIDYDEE